MKNQYGTKTALSAVARMPRCVASDIAEALLKGAIPAWAGIERQGDILLISEQAGKSPDLGCHWAWGDAGLRWDTVARTLTAFTCGGHWMTVSARGRVVAADSHYYNRPCGFWGD